MRSRKRIVRLLALLVLSLFLLGSWCQRTNPCLDIPETDSTPPTAGMLIEYFPIGNSESSAKTLTADDASTTISADEDRPVTILYSGQDPEGLKSVQISVSVVRTIGGIQQRQDHNIAPIVTSCPRKILMGTFTLEEDQGNRNATVSIQSTNWMEMQTNTQRHVIKIE